MKKKAYFAGGCFWCIAGVFATTVGVCKVYSGYSGGNKDNPTYLEVKSQTTQHREAICIEYDEDVISYEKLIDIYFENVDPFDAEGQFIDRGFSYTLALFYSDEEEKELCEKKIEIVQKQSGRKTFVSVLPYKNFFLAEEEHQDYAQKNPDKFEEEINISGRKKYFH